MKLWTALRAAWWVLVGVMQGRLTPSSVYALGQPPVEAPQLTVVPKRSRRSRCKKPRNEGARELRRLKRAALI